MRGHRLVSGIAHFPQCGRLSTSSDSDSWRSGARVAHALERGLPNVAEDGLRNGPTIMGAAARPGLLKSVLPSATFGMMRALLLR